MSPRLHLVSLTDRELQLGSEGAYEPSVLQSFLNDLNNSDLVPVARIAFNRDLYQVSPPTQRFAPSSLGSACEHV